MKLGVISDSHDNLENIEKAVKILNKENVDFLIHCGDYIAPFVVRAFKGLDNRIKNGNMIGVFGNNDGEILGLMKILGKICDIRGFEAILELGGRKIYMAHGPNPLTIKSLAKSNEFDIIASGHTHQLKVEKIGNTLVLNPGELCGYLHGKSTLIIVDLKELDAQVIEI